MIKIKHILLKYFRHLHLKNKFLLVCVLVATVPLMSISAYLYFGVIPKVKEDSKSESIKALERINLRLDNYIKEIQYQNSVILHTSEISDALQLNPDEDRILLLQHYRSIKNSLANFKGAKNNMVDFTLSGMNGEIYSTLMYLYEYDFLSYEPYQEMLKTGDISYVLPSNHPPYIFNQSDKAKLSYLYRVRDAFSNKDIGVLICDVNVEGINSLFTLESQLEDEWYVVTDRDNNVIVNTSSNDFLADEIINQPNNSRFFSVNGKEYFWAKMHSPYTGFTTYAVLSTAVLYKEADGIIIFINIIAVGAFLISLFLAYVFINSLISPIKKLQVYVNKLEGSNYEEELFIENQDEIGDLAQNLNSIRKRIKNLIENIYEDKVLRLDMELSMLQSQINPHFLYNTIQVISSIAELEGNEKIPDICEALTNIFRYNMNYANKETTLREEINHVQNYLKLLQIRYEDKIQVSYEIDKEALEYFTIKYILQPIVENSIKHGLDSCINRTWIIKIALKCNKSDIVIILEDNGKGITKEKLKKLRASFKDTIPSIVEKREIGLNNVNTRLIIKYGKEYHLILQSKENMGTKVIVRIPKSKSSKDTIRVSKGGEGYSSYIDSRR